MIRPPVTAWLASFDVLRERQFRLFFLVYATSLVGTSMAPVALTFAVLDEGGSAADVGLVLAAQTAPVVLLVLVGGVIGDRISRAAVMVVADLVRFASQGTLAWMLLVGTPSLGVFMILVAARGLGSAFFVPTMNGLIPDVTSAGRLL